MAQSSDTLFISIKDYPQGNSEIVTDTLLFNSKLDSVIGSLRLESYLLASLDSISSNKPFTAYIFRGNKYSNLEVRMSTANRYLVEAAGLGNMNFNNLRFSESQLSEMAGGVLEYLSNNGFPFADVKLDSLKFPKEEKPSAFLVINKNQQIVYDSINIEGDISIDEAFLYRYLNIRKDDLYDKSAILKIRSRLNNLPYLVSEKDPSIRFENNRAIINLFLKNKSASRFDFLIGLLPADNNGTRAWTITGELSGELQNKLGYGESMAFQFRRLKPETQELDLGFRLPYLLQAPFGVVTNFSLYRDSESFLDVEFDAGLQYVLSGNDFLKATWAYSSSRLLSIDTSGIINSQRLPDKLDLSYKGGGIEWNKQTLDYIFNPRTGWKITAGTTVGLKKIIENRTIQSFVGETYDFSESYDSLNLSSFQAIIRTDIQYFRPLTRRFVLHVRNRTAFKYNEAKLFNNELFRLGGNALLRGFDEETILADLYTVMSFELRLILDRNSYLSFPFVDISRMRARVGEEDIWDTPLGFGVGLNFSTGAGIFNVSFAMGRRLSNPIDFGNTKIHFGYVNLF